jgi:hypothetical protein
MALTPFRAESVQGIEFPSALCKQGVPPAPLPSCDVGAVSIGCAAALIAELFVVIFERRDDGHQRHPGDLTDANEKGARLFLAQLRKQIESKENVDVSVEREIIDAGETKERTCRLVGVFDRPRTMIEAPAFFSGLAKRAYQ